MGKKSAGRHNFQILMIISPVFGCASAACSTFTPASGVYAGSTGHPTLAKGPALEFTSVGQCHCIQASQSSGVWWHGYDAPQKCSENNSHPVTVRPELFKEFAWVNNVTKWVISKIAIGSITFGLIYLKIAFLFAKFLSKVAKFTINRSMWSHCG